MYIYIYTHIHISVLICFYVFSCIDAFMYLCTYWGQRSDSRAMSAGLHLPAEELARRPGEGAHEVGLWRRK